MRRISSSKFESKKRKLNKGALEGKSLLSRGDDVVEGQSIDKMFKDVLLEGTVDEDGDSDVNPVEEVEDVNVEFTEVMIFKQLQLSYI